MNIAQTQRQFKRQKKKNTAGQQTNITKNIHPKNMDITKSGKNKCSNLQKQGSNWPTKV